MPEPIRGTYAGLAHEGAVKYLRSLGVTAIELLPIHQFVHEQHQLDKGLRNYWGYHSLGYFAPHGEYSSSGDSGAQVREFKQMVKALHAGGIEVILDVVYNHTGEGNHIGPMLSLKGIDNRAYYRTVEGDARFYMDYTGTGNSLNMRHPHALMLVMDSLRYWVQEMHVDGFRFDLASTLARELYDVDRLSAFFDIIHQDPTLERREADCRTVGHRRRAGIRSETFRCAGASGTASIATRCATTGAAKAVRSPSSRADSPAARISTKTTAGSRMRA